MTRLVAAFVALAFPALCAASDAPLWELGVGVAAVHFPDYRGSSRSRTYGLPAPYLVYRGDFLKADRHGLRGVFLRTERLDLNMSVGASLPVDSSDNPARAGMPDLKPSFELGPSLDITLWRSAARDMKIDLRLPVRGAVSVESSPRFIGTQFFPHANIDIRSPFGHAGWNLGLLAGPVFTDSRYNRHYYAVAPQYASAARRAYSPGSGYAGMQLIAALSRRFPRFWVGGFVRYDTLSGAAFEDSPLVTSKRYLAGGVGISWIFAQSARRVPALDLRGEPR